MNKYIPVEIEPKWQKRWSEDKLYLSDLSDAKNKYYCLVEFSYPSGDLHMGHWYAFAVPDILARCKRMQGYNVFFPNGFDAFGLPAENAAIKNKIHPQNWTLSNIKNMKRQFVSMGASFDWSHEVISCLTSYYKWNQWIFLKMFEKGLAYKGKTLSNWCSKDQTVLANENIENGKCWRCGTEVIQKEVEQWFLKITDYAERLIWSEAEGPERSRTSNGLSTTLSVNRMGRRVDWPEALRAGQNNWIGKSGGVVLNFDGLEVFTTRIDTIFGATFIAISPQHPLLKNYIRHEKQVKEYLALTKHKRQLDRKEDKEKTGVFSGSFVTNPFNNKQIPIWIADYVLMGYGTGVVMGVPAHDARDFEFAKKYGLEIKQVIMPEGNKDKDVSKEKLDNAYEGEGILVNSSEYDGLSSYEARKKLSNYIEKHQIGYKKINYHLHDWSISRQRYWGTPIPIIYCDSCGTVGVPQKDLPVELPYKVDYAPKGKPPLATARDWVNVKCPKCGGKAKREVETMDTFIDSSWYFFRYLDPKNKDKIFDKEIIEKWMPVDIYFGGAEHTLGHTLYSRFFTKFFYDSGFISFDEYAKKRINRGLILGPNGQRMSKSRGNVVNPDLQVKKYGADAVRLYLAFIGPYIDTIAPWDDSSVWGVYHFLKRVWNLFGKVGAQILKDGQNSSKIPTLTPDDLKIMHKTIRKVTEDIENIKFNTAVAALMEWLNYLVKKAKVSTQEYKTFLLLLAPFAPHMTEELWQMMGQKYSIHQQNWPRPDFKFLKEEQVAIVVQVNGKVRAVLSVSIDHIEDKQKIEDLALEQPQVSKFLKGFVIKNTIYIVGKVLNFVI